MKARSGHQAWDCRGHSRCPVTEGAPARAPPSRSARVPSWCGWLCCRTLRTTPRPHIRIRTVSAPTRSPSLRCGLVTHACHRSGTHARGHRLVMLSLPTQAARPRCPTCSRRALNTAMRLLPSRLLPGAPAAPRTEDCSLCPSASPTVRDSPGQRADNCFVGVTAISSTGPQARGRPRRSAGRDPRPAARGAVAGDAPGARAAHPHRPPSPGSPPLTARLRRVGRAAGLRSLSAPKPTCPPQGQLEPGAGIRFCPLSGCVAPHAR